MAWYAPFRRRAVTPDALPGQTAEIEQRYTLEDFVAWANAARYSGLLSPASFAQSLGGNRYADSLPRLNDDHSTRVRGNAVIQSLVQFRVSTFSQGRMAWLRYRKGRPSEYFTDGELAILQRPWVGGSQSQLLARMLLSAETDGQAFVARRRITGATNSSGADELAVMPTRQVRVVWEQTSLGPRKLGYLYSSDPSEFNARNTIALAPDEVAHFAPIPDPTHPFNGMSWITAVTREVLADDMITAHVTNYFQNAATPNMLLLYPDTKTPDQVRSFAELWRELQEGPQNSGKTAHIGGGVTAQTPGSNLKDADATLLKAAGETRLAAAAQVPGLLVGLVQASQTASLGDYKQARARYVDSTLIPLWTAAAQALSVLLPDYGTDVTLAVDTRDIPLLRSDALEQAQINETIARTMRTLIDGGYKAESVKAMAAASDFGLLVHSGLYSVQLQPANSDQTPVPARMTRSELLSVMNDPAWRVTEVREIGAA